MKNTERLVWIYAGVMLMTLIGLAFTNNTFYIRLITEAMLLTTIALGLDLLYGYTGLLSLGHALFFGLGAYASALLLRAGVESIWLLVGGALVVSLFSGSILGALIVKVRGIYFALITFGLVQIAERVVDNMPQVGASDGISNLPGAWIGFGSAGFRSDDAVKFAFFTEAILLVIYFIVRYVLNSGIGRVMRGIKTNPHRLGFVGINIVPYKIFAFVLAGSVAAVGGALYPLLRGFVSPEIMSFHSSVNAVIAVMIGGVGTLAGALYGSMILLVFESFLGSITEFYKIGIGVAFILIVLIMPGGILRYVRTRTMETRINE